MAFGFKYLDDDKFKLRESDKHLDEPLEDEGGMAYSKMC